MAKGIVARGLLSMMLLKGTLCSTIYETIDPHHLIKSRFSSSQQNRISVVGGGVRKIMHPEGDVQFILEETSGQVFVYPLSEYPQTMTASLVLNGGLVQDLEISFEKKSSEILVLSPPELPKQATNLCYKPADTAADMCKTVKMILDGRSPPGYISCDPPKQCLRLSRGVVATLAGKLVRSKETLFLWSVQNNARSHAAVCEKQFACCDPKWVYIDKHALACREKTIAIVSVAR